MRYGTEKKGYGKLLSDAEAGEDAAEDFVGGDLSCDGTQIVEDVAEVDDYEVGGEMVTKTLSHMQQALFYMTKSLVVTGIGEHYVGSLCEVGLGSLDKCRHKGIETVAFLCGDGKREIWWDGVF